MMEKKGKNIKIKKNKKIMNEDIEKNIIIENEEIEKIKKIENEEDLFNSNFRLIIFLIILNF